MHPFLVLSVLPNENNSLRIGITASKAVGSAVQRNRARRRLRAVADFLLPILPAGWDVVMIARKPVLTANFVELREVVIGLMKRACLLPDSRKEFND